jgi:putative SbcD/Mre11-related phosphoesterase
MKLNDDIELIDGLPVIFIRSLNAIAVADLHLGYEGVMAKRGMFLPKVNLRKIVDVLAKSLNKTQAKTIIVDGDIKNEFSRVDEEEFNELLDFIKFTKDSGVGLILIKGNHDNFVDRYRDPFSLKIYGNEAKMGRYIFFHGDELPGVVPEDVDMLVMGHEHPAIGIFNRAGKKEKLRCFLYGEYEGKKLLVLPAMNYFASGSDINIIEKKDLLSPIFKYVNVDEMQAIPVGYGSTINFGKIRALRVAL